MSAPRLRLGHVNIRAESLEDTVSFYERALGLRRRQSDTNPDTRVNLWLCDDMGQPCIHVNQARAGEALAANGTVDHFAFDVEDRAAMERHLRALDIPYDTVPFPHARIVQFNLRDPNGVKVELTFRDQD